ncbi:MAG: hypothetical protein ABMA15_12995 [Vicinamibacterales bacterium]
MRRYTAEDEDRIRLQARVRDWVRTGLLRPEQAEQLRSGLQVGLRRTGVMLRVGLALFTFVIVGASVGLMFLLLDLRDEIPVGTTLAAMGALSLVAANALVARFRLYRHGVEEALSISGAVLLGVAAVVLGFGISGTQNADLYVAAGLVVSALTGIGIYLRFGFQYAGVGALVLAAISPLPLGSLSSSWKHLLAAGISGIALAAANVTGQQVSEERFQDDAGVFRAAALVCAYLSLNVYAIGGLSMLFGSTIEPWFIRSTYAATWVLPVLGLHAGVRIRDRRLIEVSLALAVVTLVTNKSYLGLARQPWDPMLLGILLVGVAIVVRRWLAAGTGGARAGYTAVQLLESESRAIQVAGMASATVHPGPIGESSPTHTEFSGGRSGGAGGGGEF